MPVKYKPTGIPVDVAAGVSRFDKNAIQRSRTITFGTTSVSVCSPEDLIIYKLIAGRQLDLYDVELLFKFRKDTLDAHYLTETAKGFREIERGDVFESIQMLIQKYLSH